MVNSLCNTAKTNPKGICRMLYEKAFITSQNVLVEPVNKNNINLYVIENTPTYFKVKSNVGNEFFRWKIL